jgi:hypothetical protein
MGPLFECRAFEMPLRGDFLPAGNYRCCSWGNMDPDCCTFTLFRLELGIHIPPPPGIPPGCVLGFAKDRSTATPMTNTQETGSPGGSWQNRQQDCLLLPDSAETSLSAIVATFVDNMATMADNDHGQRVALVDRGGGAVVVRLAVPHPRWTRGRATTNR